MTPNYYNQGPVFYTPSKATGWLVATYICALMGGLLAIAFGLTVFSSKVYADGYRVPKYIKSHRVFGLIGAILGAVSAIVWRVALM